MTSTQISSNIDAVKWEDRIFRPQLKEEGKREALLDGPREDTTTDGSNTKHEQFVFLYLLQFH